MPTEGGAEVDHTALSAISTPKVSVATNAMTSLSSVEADPMMGHAEGDDPVIADSTAGGAQRPAEEASGRLHSRRRSSSRRASFVVYPEAEDDGKPKVFARQSFVVSGEEEEMAETILKARMLAGQRRRSTIVVDPNLDSNNQRAIVDAAACNLAARRDSASDSAALTETAGEAETEEGQSGSTKDGEALTSNVDSEVARRRSSVLQRIPDNLRALVQQSDASGVQQKTEIPYVPPSPQQAVPASPSATAARQTSGDRASNSGGGGRPVWLRNMLHFLRRKGNTASRNKSNNNPRSSDKSDGHGDDGRYTPEASPYPAPEQEQPLLGPQLPKFAGRKQLILDLDETLVHSSFKPVAGADYIMDIKVDSTYYKVFVRKRPGVDEFLRRVARDYEVIIFTASLPQYANPLLDLLDPTRRITSRLFREHCTFHEGYFVKDLTRLRFQSLESTIIVDNSPMAYMFQPENAIDCMSWIDEQDDRELYVIADFLEAVVGVPDVRDLLEFWREGSHILQPAS